MKRVILVFAAILPFVLLTSCYRVEKVEVGDTVNGTVWVTEDTGGWFGIGPCWVEEKTKDTMTFRFLSEKLSDIKWEEEIRQLADGSETVTQKYWAVMSSREVPKDELMSLYMAREQKPMPSANWTGPVVEFQGDALPDFSANGLTVEENRALAARDAALTYLNR